MFNKKTLLEKEVTKIILVLILLINVSAILASAPVDILQKKTNRNNELPYNWNTNNERIERDVKEQNIGYVGSCMWSQVSKVFSTGTDVWASFNNGLCRIDIYDISNPVFVSKLYIPCESKGITGTNDIIIEGSYAYIGDMEGLRIVNIGKGELISTFPLRRAHTLFLRDTILYVVDGTGLKVLNITNPAAPDSIGFYPISGAVGIDVDSNNYAYISDTGNMGLTILDITIPENPAFVSNYHTPGYGNYVTFANGYAFIADHNNGLEIVDVTIPLNPVFKSHIQTSGSARDVKVSGNYAFVAADKMDVVDISNLNAPFIAKSFSTMDNVMSIFLNGDYLFSSEGSFLEILNIQQPVNTFLEGSLERPYWLQEVKIEVKIGQDIAYIADMGEIYLVPGGLKIIDITEKENPFLREEYSMDLFALPNYLDIKNNYVYMKDKINGTYTLITLDVNNPSAPQLAGEYQSSAAHIFAGDSLIYILDNDSLKILDLQDPLNPSVEGSLALSNNALRICVDNGYAFIAGNGVNTLWIVNVSNCSDPQLITSITTACNYARDILVQDSLLYLVCDQYIQIININSIDNPSIICTYDEVTYATDICVKNNFAYIADYNLLKIDITDPAAPFLVETYPIPGCSYNVAALDNYIFVTTESSFLILQDSDLLQVDTKENIFPTGTSLLQNYPNPFNPSTAISYQLSAVSDVELTVYNSLGQKVRTLVNERQPAGAYQVNFDASGLASGVYYYKIKAGNFTQVKKMLLIR